MEIRGQEETIQITALLRLAEETCCHSDSSGKPSANAGVKKSHKQECNQKIVKLKFPIFLI